MADDDATTRADVDDVLGALDLFAIAEEDFAAELSDAAAMPLAAACRILRLGKAAKATYAQRVAVLTGAFVSVSRCKEALTPGEVAFVARFTVQATRSVLDLVVTSKDAHDYSAKVETLLQELVRMLVFVYNQAKAHADGLVATGGEWTAASINDAVLMCINALVDEDHGVTVSENAGALNLPEELAKKVAVAAPGAPKSSTGSLPAQTNTQDKYLKQLQSLRTVTTAALTQQAKQQKQQQQQHFAEGAGRKHFAGKAASCIWTYTDFVSSFFSTSSPDAKTLLDRAALANVSTLCLLSAAAPTTLGNETIHASLNTFVNALFQKCLDDATFAASEDITSNLLIVLSRGNAELAVIADRLMLLLSAVYLKHFSSSKSIRFMEMASTLLNADPATKPHATTTSATFTINCVSPPIDLLSLPTTTESFAAVYAQFGVADVVNELLKGIETLLNDQSRPVVSAPEAASGGKNAVVQEEEEEAFSLFGEPARSEEEDDSEDDEDDQHGLSQTQATRVLHAAARVFSFIKNFAVLSSDAVEAWLAVGDGLSGLELSYSKEFGTLVNSVREPWRRTSTLIFSANKPSLKAVLHKRGFVDGSAWTTAASADICFLILLAVAFDDETNQEGDESKRWNSANVAAWTRQSVVHSLAASDPVAISEDLLITAIFLEITNSTSTTSPISQWSDLLASVTSKSTAAAVSSPEALNSWLVNYCRLLQWIDFAACHTGDFSSKLQARMSALTSVQSSDLDRCLQVLIEQKLQMATTKSLMNVNAGSGSPPFLPDLEDSSGETQTLAHLNAAEANKLAEAVLSLLKFASKAVVPVEVMDISLLLQANFTAQRILSSIELTTGFVTQDPVSLDASLQFAVRNLQQGLNATPSKISVDNWKSLLACATSTNAYLPSQGRLPFMWLGSAAIALNLFASSVLGLRKDAELADDWIALGDHVFATETLASIVAILQTLQDSYLQLLVESTKLNDDMVGIVKGLVSAGIDISTVLPADGGAEWQVQLQEAASAMSSVDPAKYSIDEIYGLYMENVLVQSSVNVLALSVLHWVYTIGNLLTARSHWLLLPKAAKVTDNVFSSTSPEAHKATKPLFAVSLNVAFAFSRSACNKVISKVFPEEKDRKVASSMIVVNNSIALLAHLESLLPSLSADQIKSLQTSVAVLLSTWEDSYNRDPAILSPAAIAAVLPHGTKVEQLLRFVFVKLPQLFQTTPFSIQSLTALAAFIAPSKPLNTVLVDCLCELTTEDVDAWVSHVLAGGAKTEPPFSAFLKQLISLKASYAQAAQLSTKIYQCIFGKLTSVILAGTQSAVETLLMIIASVLEQADASEPFAKQAVVLFDELIKSDDILLKPDVLANVKAFVVLITLASTSDPSATEALAKTELKLAKPTQRGLPEVNFAFDLSNPFARTNVFADAAAATTSASPKGPGFAESFASSKEIPESKLFSQLCTYAKTGKDYSNQHWYYCYTCNLSSSEGCCTVCARVCHGGHDIVYARMSSFFCDCGAGRRCQCLAPRDPVPAHERSGSPPASPSQSLHLFIDTAGEEWAKLYQTLETVVARLWQLVDLSIAQVEEQQSQNAKAKNATAEASAANWTCSESMVVEANSFVSFADQKLFTIPVDSPIERRSSADALRILEGASENGEDDDIDDLLKDHILGHNWLASSNKFIVTVLNDTTLMSCSLPTYLQSKQASLPIDGPKATTSFSIMSVVLHPHTPNLIVAGTREIEICSLHSETGAILNRYNLNVSHEHSSFHIMSVQWVPYTVNCVVVATNKFVKIFDLAQDTISPAYFFSLPDPSNAVVACTLARHESSAEQSTAAMSDLTLFVQTLDGIIYSQDLKAGCNQGQIPLTRPLENVRPSTGPTTPNRISSNNGGASVFFAAKLQLLIYAYENGDVFAGRLNDDHTSLKESFAAVVPQQRNAPGALRRLHNGAPYHDFKEIVVDQHAVKGQPWASVLLIANSRRAPHLVVFSFSPPQVQAQIIGLQDHIHITSFAVAKLPVGSEQGTAQQVLLMKSEMDDIFFATLSDKLVNDSDSVVLPESLIKPAVARPSSSAAAPAAAASAASSTPNGELPLTIFELLDCATKSILVSSDDLGISPSQIKSRITSNDQVLKATSPSGFALNIKLPDPDANAIVAMRVLLGNSNTSAIPQRITVFEQEFVTKASVPRYYAVVLNERSIEQAMIEGSVTVRFSSCWDGAQYPTMDKIDVFTAAKSRIDSAKKTAGSSSSQPLSRTATPGFPGLAGTGPFRRLDLWESAQVAHEQPSGAFLGSLVKYPLPPVAPTFGHSSVEGLLVEVLAVVRRGLAVKKDSAGGQKLLEQVFGLPRTLAVVPSAWTHAIVLARQLIGGEPSASSIAMASSLNAVLAKSAIEAAKAALADETQAKLRKFPALEADLLVLQQLCLLRRFSGPTYFGNLDLSAFTAQFEAWAPTIANSSLDDSGVSHVVRVIGRLVSLHLAWAMELVSAAREEDAKPVLLPVTQSLRVLLQSKNAVVSVGAHDALTSSFSGGLARLRTVILPALLPLGSDQPPKLPKGPSASKPHKKNIYSDLFEGDDDDDDEDNEYDDEDEELFPPAGTSYDDDNYDSDSDSDSSDADEPSKSKDAKATKTSSFTAPSPPAADSAAAAAAAAEVYRCDGCELQPIIGERYHCRSCPDYDICAICFASGIHEEHNMERFDIEEAPAAAPPTAAAASSASAATTPSTTAASSVVDLPKETVQKVRASSHWVTLEEETTKFQSVVATLTNELINTDLKEQMAAAPDALASLPTLSLLRLLLATLASDSAVEQSQHTLLLESLLAQLFPEPGAKWDAAPRPAAELVRLSALAYLLTPSPGIRHLRATASAQTQRQIVPQVSEATSLATANYLFMSQGSYVAQLLPRAQQVLSLAKQHGDRILEPLVAAAGAGLAVFHQHTETPLLGLLQRTFLPFFQGSDGFDFGTTTTGHKDASAPAKDGARSGKSGFAHSWEVWLDPSALSRPITLAAALLVARSLYSSKAQAESEEQALSKAHWQTLACECAFEKSLVFVKKHAKAVLIALNDSRGTYRSVLDNHLFGLNVTEIERLVQPVLPLTTTWTASTTPATATTPSAASASRSLSWSATALRGAPPGSSSAGRSAAVSTARINQEDIATISRLLSSVSEQVNKRPWNWQKFVLDRFSLAASSSTSTASASQNVVQFLVQLLSSPDTDAIAPQVLKLLRLALTISSPPPPPAKPGAAPFSGDDGDASARTLLPPIGGRGNNGSTNASGSTDNGFATSFLMSMIQTMLSYDSPGSLTASSALLSKLAGSSDVGNLLRSAAASGPFGGKSIDPILKQYDIKTVSAVPLVDRVEKDLLGKKEDGDPLFREMIEGIVGSSSSPSSDIASDSLDHIVQTMLLHRRHEPTRLEAREVFYWLYWHGSRRQQLALGAALWRTLPRLASLGPHIQAFMDALSFVHRHTTLSLELLDVASAEPAAAASSSSSASSVGEGISSLRHELTHQLGQLVTALKQFNRALVSHPNTAIYEGLLDHIDRDGLFLESSPCAGCSSSESVFESMDVEQIKAETKYTPNATILRLNKRYTFSSIHIKVSEIRRFKMVSSVELFYNNKTITDMNTLKNNSRLWRSLGTFQMRPMQNELSCVLYMPITAMNLKIQFSSFHESATGSEKLICPRCSRIVTDRHGICRNCHENAFQCRHCRNINYENLQSFLCIDCGRSSYANFVYSFQARPSLEVDQIDNEVDERACIAVVEKESQSARAFAQKLDNLRKPLEAMLFSMGPIRAGDSTTVSAAGHNTHKLPRRLLLLETLYNRDCRNAAEGLTRSIQLLASARQELLRYSRSGRLRQPSQVQQQQGLQQKTRSAPETPVPVHSGESQSTACYGCTARAIHELRQLLADIVSSSPSKAQALYDNGLLTELLSYNLRRGSNVPLKSASSGDARPSTMDQLGLLVCALAKDNAQATTQVIDIVRSKVDFALQNLASLDVSTVLGFEVTLLCRVALLNDTAWEQRMRGLFEIFFKAVQHGSQNSLIVDRVILPCLLVLIERCTGQASNKQLGGGKAKPALKNTTIADKPTEQWVARVLDFSSQYNDTTWAADQVIGAPKVYPNYGDLHGAWAPRVVGRNDDFIVLQFDEPVLIQAIHIYETNAPGGVVRILALPVSPEDFLPSVAKAFVPIATRELMTEIWTGPGTVGLTPPTARIFSPKLTDTSVIARVIRIELNCHGSATWTEIDAIKLTGPVVSQLSPPNVSAAASASPSAVSLPQPVQVSPYENLLKEIPELASLPELTYDVWMNQAESFEQWIGRIDSNKSYLKSKEGKLVSKYAKIWLKRTAKGRKSVRASSSSSSTSAATLLSEGLVMSGPTGWLPQLLLNSRSSAVRSQAARLMVVLSSDSIETKLAILKLLTTMLGVAVTGAKGECSREFFLLFSKLAHEESAKKSIVKLGFLNALCAQIEVEATRIRALDEAGVNAEADLAQGYVLMEFVDVLVSFVNVPSIRRTFIRSALNGQLLSSYLSLRGLVLQRSNLTQEAAGKLLELVQSIAASSTEETERFLFGCMGAFEQCQQDWDTKSATFILEQVCNIIRPEKPLEPFAVQMDKIASQEEFIRGSLTHNPYPHTDCGELMRDVKNKICTVLELYGLLEDDNGMELLVDNKIVNLQLPLRDVYEHVWKTPERTSSNGSVPPMVIVYRLQGLDGLATEERVDTIEIKEEQTQDPEEAFKITGVIGTSGGLGVCLNFLAAIEDIKSQHELFLLILRLLSNCVNVQTNRRLLWRLDALRHLLDKLKLVFMEEAKTKGEEISQTLLRIMESIVTEGNRDITNTATAQEEGDLSQDGDGTHMDMFLEKLSSPLLMQLATPQSQQVVAAITRVLPFLTYGVEKTMAKLLDFFLPHLKLDEFDAKADGTELDKRASALATKKMFHANSYHLDCLVHVTESIKEDPMGNKLKSFFLAHGLHTPIVKYIQQCRPAGFPATSTADEWAPFLAKPALTIALRLLAGLAFKHAETQSTLAHEQDLLAILHQMEQLTSEQRVGSYAELVLEALCVDNEAVAAQVAQVREVTKERKKAIALAQRQAMLKTMGFQLASESEGGKIVSTVKVEGIDEIEKEQTDAFALTCIVCQEGYQYKPDEILGIYVYNKLVPIGLGANDQSIGRSEKVILTVSHFHAIHVSCHQHASRLDRSGRAHREEWDGATLRNSNTKCNNLLPVQGPGIKDDRYSHNVLQYLARLSDLGLPETSSRFRQQMHETRALLVKIAFKESLSQDSLGGGRESNLKLVPFLVQMGLYYAKSNSTQSPTSLLNSLQSYVDAPASFPSGSEADDVCYYLTMSLHLFSKADFEKNRLKMFTRVLLLALRRAGAIAKQQQKQAIAAMVTPTVTDKFNEAAQPLLVLFSVVSLLHTDILVPVPSASSATSTPTAAAAPSPTAAASALVEERHALLRDHSSVVIRRVHDLLGRLDDEIFPLELCEEFADVLGLLDEIIALHGSVDGYLQAVFAALV